METSFESLEQAHGIVSRERVMRDLKTLARDTEDLLKVTAGDVGDKAKELRARLSDALQRAKETYADLQEQTVASAKRAAKNTDTVIRDNPWQAVGIALGVGLLVGVLVARK
jgi:ElaB/YqjD/DUF883 family membrane-anchored ribosome-binding protein